MPGFSPEEFAQMAQEGEVFERAHLLAVASIGQFLCDRYEDLGYDSPQLHAAAMWSVLINHDYSTSDPKPVSYIERNRARVGECCSDLIATDREFAQAFAFAAYLEFGFRVAYFNSKGAPETLSTEPFKLLTQLHPELARSPETLDPHRAIAFFKEWDTKWNKRIQSAPR